MDTLGWCYTMLHSEECPWLSTWLIQGPVLPLQYGNYQHRLHELHRPSKCRMVHAALDRHALCFSHAQGVVSNSQELPAVQGKKFRLPLPKTVWTTTSNS